MCTFLNNDEHNTHTSLDPTLQYSTIFKDINLLNQHEVLLFDRLPFSNTMIKFHSFMSHEIFIVRF